MRKRHMDQVFEEDCIISDQGDLVLESNNSRNMYTDILNMNNQKDDKLAARRSSFASSLSSTEGGSGSDRDPQGELFTINSSSSSSDVEFADRPFYKFTHSNVFNDAAHSKVLPLPVASHTAERDSDDETEESENSGDACADATKYMSLEYRFRSQPPPHDDGSSSGGSGCNNDTLGTNEMEANTNSADNPSQTHTHTHTHSYSSQRYLMHDDKIVRNPLIGSFEQFLQQRSAHAGSSSSSSQTTHSVSGMKSDT